MWLKLLFNVSRFGWKACSYAIGAIHYILLFFYSSQASAGSAGAHPSKKNGGPFRWEEEMSMAQNFFEVASEIHLALPSHHDLTQLRCSANAFGTFARAIPSWGGWVWQPECYILLQSEGIAGWFLTIWTDVGGAQRIFLKPDVFWSDRFYSGELTIELRGSDITITSQGTRFIYDLVPSKASTDNDCGLLYRLHSKSKSKGGETLYEYTPNGLISSIVTLEGQQAYSLHYDYQGVLRILASDGQQVYYEQKQVVDTGSLEDWRLVSAHKNEQNVVLYSYEAYNNAVVKAQRTRTPVHGCWSCSYPVAQTIQTLYNQDVFFQYWLALFAKIDNFPYAWSLDRWLPFFCPQSTRFVYAGESYIGTGIGFINGINTSFGFIAEQVAALQQDAQNSRIYCVFNAAASTVIGFVETCMAQQGICFSPVYLLLEQWKDFFDQQPSEARFLQLCHSQGVVFTRQALELAPESIRSRIVVIAIAPPFGDHIPSEHCEHVYHYVSATDPIPTMFVQEAPEDWIILESERFFDHDFFSPTFRPYIQYHLERFLIEQINDFSEPTIIARQE